MSLKELQTKRLRLIPQTREDLRAEIGRMGPADRAHVSAAWLEMLENSELMDPWIHGFRILGVADGILVGQCGFKGPPDTEGMVEIAYGVLPEQQGKGFATEAAEALVQYAFADARVRLVRAHTLPESNASTRVLLKTGFRKVGEVFDPEDGPVWRWERVRA
ncbi:MAG: GNAT family N-acetyltransferase [Verrucomicrobiota bacterium]